jgi:hypothetical protein
MLEARRATDAGGSRTAGLRMEPLMLLGMLIGIIFIGYALVNVVFRLFSDALTYLEENRLRIIVAAAILIALWFGVHS